MGQNNRWDSMQEILVCDSQTNSTKVKKSPPGEMEANETDLETAPTPVKMKVSNG